MSLVCCLGIAIATDHGDVEISAEDAEAKAFLERASLRVIDHHKKTHVVKAGPNRLPSGGYLFDATGLPASIQIAPNPFSLTRGETLEITFRSVTPKPPKLPRPELVMVTSDQARHLQRDWAAFLRIDVNDTSSVVGPKLTLIPPGDFLMGSTDEQIKQYQSEFKKKFEPRPDPKRLDAEKPQHRVRISKPFYLSATEVTYGQFTKFVAATRYMTEPEQKGKEGGTGIEFGKDPARKPDFSWKNTGFSQSAESPVCNITWKDVEAYCRWLSGLEKKKYRLPTEAEWEYACRAGTTTHWYFGDELKDSNVREYMWLSLPVKFGKNFATSHPVGKKKTNDFGLHDMHGNIAEMCADFYDPASYETRAKEILTTDPKGPDASPTGQRVVRGGSFLDPPSVARASYRFSVDPAQGNVGVGFRIVCEVPVPAE